MPLRCCRRHQMVSGAIQLRVQVTISEVRTILYVHKRIFLSFILRHVSMRIEGSLRSRCWVNPPTATGNYERGRCYSCFWPRSFRSFVLNEALLTLCFAKKRSSASY